MSEQEQDQDTELGPIHAPPGPSGDPAPEAGAPARATPLLPEAGAAGVPLTVVVAILAFLASLAMAANIVVDRAVDTWTVGLTSAVTVQVKGEDADAIADAAERAATVLRGTPGVLTTDILSREDTEALLEPWFGTGLPGDVPVPGLVTAEVTPALRADLATLRADLASAVPDAVLDDHGAFNDRLLAAAARVRTLTGLIFSLVMLAAAAVIIFAARAGLAANRTILEVMHLVGASDGFVANQVQRRYFALGLRGGLAGASLAAITVSVLVLASSGEGAFLPRVEISARSLAWLLVVPVVLCLVAATAARLTVLRTLRRGV